MVDRFQRVRNVSDALYALLRLVIAVLEKTQEDWQIQRRYFNRESMRKLKPPASEAEEAVFV